MAYFIHKCYLCPRILIFLLDMNMKKTFLATICLFTGMTMYSQQIDIQPVPQKMTPATQTIQLTGHPRGYGRVSRRYLGYHLLRYRTVI